VFKTLPKPAIEISFLAPTPSARLITVIDVMPQAGIAQPRKDLIGGRGYWQVLECDFEPK